jgi:hypothetical protein
MLELYGDRARAEVRRQVDRHAQADDAGRAEIWLGTAAALELVLAGQPTMAVRQ